MLKAQPPGIPTESAPTGRYELPWRTGDAHLYRLNHPLAEALLLRAKSRELPPAEILFNYADHEGKVSILEPLIGASGWLTMAEFSVNALDQAEDHLLCAGVTDSGRALDTQTVCRLLTLPGQTGNTILPRPSP